MDKGEISALFPIVRTTRSGTQAQKGEAPQVQGV